MTSPLSTPPLPTESTPDEPRYFRFLGVIIGPRTRTRAATRFAWGVTAAVCATILGIAAYLLPSPAGHGTHEALRLNPCGFIIRTGLPCPTCGMTTAFSHLVRGHIVRSFISQPAGMIFGLLTIGLTIVGTAVAVTGQSYYLDWNGVSPRVLLGLGLLILFGWGFKLAHGLLTGELPIQHG
ncbi:MAG: DUF2752 domain-containing protein [Phycisphaerae bacterium]|nr:DUF2752 domain-containing protein [Phycisphaerae bacterium]